MLPLHIVCIARFIPEPIVDSSCVWSSSFTQEAFMRTRNGGKFCLGLLILACVWLAAEGPAKPRGASAAVSVLSVSGRLYPPPEGDLRRHVAPPPLPLHCAWGAPTSWPNSVQVVMTPVVMDFGGPPFGTAKVAFISFENANQILNDRGGVLRMMDQNCHDVASYSSPPPPLPCPSNLLTTPRLAPASGLAVGNIDGSPDVEIVAVIDEPTTSDHKQIVAFTLIAGQLVPKWCSQPLLGNDRIPFGSAPAIAQLDAPAHLPAWSEIVIHNKVFNADGALRFSGWTYKNNCAAGSGVPGGLPCPQSRTVAVANVLGTPLPQVITGRGIYESSPAAGPAWTGRLAWVAAATPLVWKVNNVFPAVAELDAGHPGPEIVVSDWTISRLRVLSAAGVQLTSVLLPANIAGQSCGGPPMIGNADGLPGPEIGVASCDRYTLYRYSAGSLIQLWTTSINDPSGATTSTLYNSPAGARIYYADQDNLHVFDGANGNVLSLTPNSSGTGVEAPVIASFDTGRQALQGSCTRLSQGKVIVAANNFFTTGGQAGVRIFDDDQIGLVGSCWNQHTFHLTNVTNSFGVIPVVEQPSWGASLNTYRVQR
jgi:hypothetical protein